MQTIDHSALSSSASRYVKWAANPLELLSAWQLEAGFAALVSDSQNSTLICEGQVSALEYARLVAFSTPHHLTQAILPTALATTLNVQRPHRWFWMLREEPLRSLPQGCEVIRDGSIDPQLRRFLQVAAPDSSREPGHPEIEFWVVHRSQSGEIDGCAAGSRWSTGLANLVSVATDPDSRGKGIGSAVTQVATSEWFAHGEVRVALGVRSTNLRALSVYRRVGFLEEHDFTTFSL